MAWTAPRTWTTGEIVTAAIMNTHVRDNLNYIKGATGATLFEGDVQFDNDTQFYAALSGANPLLNFDANDYQLYDRTGNVHNWYVNNVVAGSIDASGVKLPTSLYALGAVGASRHVESGTSAAESVAQAATNDDAFTFVNAFASNPAVADGMTHTGTGPSDDARVLIKTATLSTTGVTLQKYNNVAGGVTMTTYYIAEGAD